MKKVSVIVPIYNTRKELVKCLRSICDQTYKDLEIICVDDGSSDGSEQIVDEYAEQDERIIVVHKKNGGESSARNEGLRISTGEYIAFCDCDDWIDENMYETLVLVLEEEKVDLVASGWYQETNGTCLEIKNELSVKQDAFGRDDLLKYLYMRDSYRGFAYMWNKLYRKEILKDRQGNIILFDETLRLGGDVVYLAEAALNTKKAKYIDQAYYHYNQREESGCHTKDVDKLRDWLRAYEIILQKFEIEHVDEEVVDYVKRFMAYHSSNAAEIAIAQGEKNAKKEFQRIMRLYEQEYVTLNTQYPERIQRFYGLLTR